MAITRVSSTTNGAEAIRYSTDENEKKHKGEVAMQRVLADQGNCLDPQHAAEQMQAVWKSFGKDDGKTVQAYRIIQSFSDNELNYENIEDIQKANEIGLELARKLYPDRQSLIVTQADGKGHKVHNHIIVNSVSALDGKSLRANEKSWLTISQASDEIIQNYEMTPLDKTKRNETSYGINEFAIVMDERFSWKDKIRMAVDNVKEREDVTNFEEFAKHLKEFDVEVKLRGKTLTYQVTYEDEKKGEVTRKSRAKKLGEDYGLERINVEFERNNQSREQRKQLKQIKRIESIATDERESAEWQISEPVSRDFRRTSSDKRQSDGIDESSRETEERPTTNNAEPSNIAITLQQVRERKRAEELERLERIREKNQRNERVITRNENSQELERDDGPEF